MTRPLLRRSSSLPSLPSDPNLRNQVLEYKEKIAEETAKHQKIQNEATSAEQYRAQEVDDLRVLTDAQEEEIDKLRKGLEEALQEVELREEDLEELRGMAEKADKAELLNCCS